MAKGKSTRREFDWRSYTKPPRILSDEQAESLLGGVLAPLLDWAKRHASVRFEIRSRQAAIYFDGMMLLRIRGAEHPFVGEVDSNVRLPRSDRTGAEQLEYWPLSSASEVAAAVAELDELRELSERLSAGEPPSERSVLHAFATANDGRSGSDSRYIVADTEFQYGKRRYDFVAMRRADAVGGLGAYTSPRMVFGQLKSNGRPLSGTSGIVAHAADYAEFAQALGGLHIASARRELDALVQQKLRLGLFSEDLPFRHFPEDDPEYLLVFSGYDLASETLDAPLVQMHDKLVARHCRPELLRFAEVDAERSTHGASPLWLGADEALSYREFKRYRKELRSADSTAPHTTEG